MCRYISAFHHPETGEILVADLNSHGETEKLLGLDPAGPYREMHYLPDGEIECRVTDADVVQMLPATAASVIDQNTIAAYRCLMGWTCEQRVRAHWPTFAEFETWAKASF